ncbi:MAG TPA: DNA-binding protein WhiA [Clostridiales bacterium]|nr:DNA-binding protein WhiA [Clostridiales bacterium]
MSFSADVKNELCKIRPSGCCKIAECYGILLFSRAFSKQSVSLITEHEEVANRLSELLRILCGVSVKLQAHGSIRDFYSVSVEDVKDRLKILEFFGHSHDEISPRINKNNLMKDCCEGAFIRGAFLAAGSITNPQKDYHVEFLTSHKSLADDMVELLSNRGFTPRITKRGATSVIYFKESNNIEDLLTIMNATGYTLELMNIKIYKNVRNKINRLTNCETANIAKTVNAAIKQQEAIRILEESGKLQQLSRELIEAAELRKNNPDMSLSELSKLCGLTRSGLNHRLRKLIKLAGLE